MAASDLVQDFLDGLTVAPAGNDTFTGTTPEWHGPEVLFGGVIVGQATSAVVQTVDDDRLLHSIHGHFLRPVRVGTPTELRVERVRDGRTFTTRRVDLLQEGKLTFTLMASFHTGGDGVPYEEPMPGAVPQPDSLPVDDNEWEGPFEFREVGATESGEGGYRASTMRQWFRLASPGPDAPLANAVVLAYATDMTRTSGRPHRLEGDVAGMISLDHAVWFHRPVRADEWLLFDVHALVSTAGRTLIRGTMRTRDGELAVSMAQEMVILIP
ncbi:MAG TPA: acyl-CoA thioesterase domain-containing protein [Acidimicrobiales bacterium]|nr:acyl-CoA thioesterase domain-containing protein [Acidimicrobiales bacterium]